MFRTAFRKEIWGLEAATALGIERFDAMYLN